MRTHCRLTTRRAAQRFEKQLEREVGERRLILEPTGEAGEPLAGGKDGAVHREVDEAGGLGGPATGLRAGDASLGEAPCGAEGVADAGGHGLRRRLADDSGTVEGARA